jgi:DNA-binding transcriptional LysR family regulator
VAHAAASGIGLAPLPDIVFEEPPLAEPTLYVVYGRRRYLPLKIRGFIDFLTEVSATTPVPKLTAFS